MPPQPLSSTCRDCFVHIDAFALRRHPTMAGKVADIIAIWSYIETVFGIILTRCLDSAVKPGMAMYLALTSSGAQEAALIAAAKTSLPPEDKDLFDAVLKVANRAGKKRHGIAHGLWGTTVKIDDALMLVDPDALLEQHVRVITALSDWDRSRPKLMPTDALQLDNSRVYVYREHHFDEIIDELNSAWNNAIMFSTLLKSSSPDRQRLHQMLSAAPEIRAELERARKSLSRTR